MSAYPERVHGPRGRDAGRRPRGFGDTTCRVGCGECQGACPRGVPVNGIMRYEYYFRRPRPGEGGHGRYAGLGGANACRLPGLPGPCEAACPHGVPIQGKLLLAHATLTLP